MFVFKIVEVATLIRTTIDLLVRRNFTASSDQDQRNIGNKFLCEVGKKA